MEIAPHSSLDSDPAKEHLLAMLRRQKECAIDIGDYVQAGELRDAEKSVLHAASAYALAETMELEYLISGDPRDLYVSILCRSQRGM